jgi:hypothetical protein
VRRTGPDDVSVSLHDLVLWRYVLETEHVLCFYTGIMV